MTHECCFDGVGILATIRYDTPKVDVLLSQCFFFLHSVLLRSSLLWRYLVAVFNQFIHYSYKSACATFHSPRHSYRKCIISTHRPPPADLPPDLQAHHFPQYPPPSSPPPPHSTTSSFSPTAAQPATPSQAPQHQRQRQHPTPS